MKGYIKFYKSVLSGLFRYNIFQNTLLWYTENKDFLNGRVVCPTLVIYKI